MQRHFVQIAEHVPGSTRWVGASTTAPPWNRHGTQVACRLAMPTRDRTIPYVLVVSDNAETAERLRSYLDGAGLTTERTSSLDALIKRAPATGAIVLFPDDFEHAAVSARLTEVRRDRPRVLILLITGEAARFDAALAGEVGPRPLVLPKPSFGWSILDAIRAHASALSP